jgi:hypothetical protein
MRCSAFTLRTDGKRTQPEKPERALGKTPDPNVSRVLGEKRKRSFFSIRGLSRDRVARLRLLPRRVTQAGRLRVEA